MTIESIKQDGVHVVSVNGERYCEVQLAYLEYVNPSPGKEGMFIRCHEGDASIHKSWSSLEWTQFNDFVAGLRFTETDANNAKKIVVTGEQ